MNPMHLVILLTASFLLSALLPLTGVAVLARGRKKQ